MLREELEKFGAKGDLSAGDLDVGDKLAHSIKNLCKVMDDEEYSRRGSSYDDGSSYRRGRSYYRDDGMDASYRRGRGRNARRDSRGRYSRDGYSRSNDDFIEQMRELMDEAPNDDIRQRMHQMMDQI